MPNKKQKKMIKAWTIKDIAGKENPTLEEIDAWICQSAEKISSNGDGKKWTKEGRTAICRWVLRTLIYGKLKVDVLEAISKDRKRARSKRSKEE
mgnify:CR=1 FL=1